MNQGFILLHRKIRDNQLWPTNKPFTKMEAWVDLLLMARYDYEPCEVLLGKEIVICDRGQVIRSINTYQKRWNWGAQRVKSFFEILLKLKQISKKTTTKTTIITILNYDSYQSKQQTKNKPKINEKQTKNKPKTTKKQRETKRNNVKEIILYLNSKSGKNFKPSTKKTKDLIVLRLTEFSIKDFKTVIDNKVSDWKNNPDMDKFLRPETLFGNKFEGYLNENTIKEKSIFDEYENILSQTNDKGYKILIELKKEILYTFDSVITLDEYNKLDLNGKANKALFISFQSYGKNKKDFLNNLYSHVRKY